MKAHTWKKRLNAVRETKRKILYQDFPLENVSYAISIMFEIRCRLYMLQILCRFGKKERAATLTMLYS